MDPEPGEDYVETSCAEGLPEERVVCGPDSDFYNVAGSDEYLDKIAHEDYDLDDVIRDISEVPDHFELVEAGDNIARYNGDAGTLEVKPVETGWEVRYERDERIEVQYEMTLEQVPAWTRALTGSGEVVENIPTQDEEEIGVMLQDLEAADRLLSEHSVVEEGFLISPE